EDGIRDLIVTGVQTCALPILRHLVGRSIAGDNPPGWMVRVTRVVRRVVVRPPHADSRTLGKRNRPRVSVSLLPTEIPVIDLDQQIGRASCRERGWIRARCE